jgi:DNA modification methylase
LSHFPIDIFGKLCFPFPVLHSSYSFALAFGADQVGDLLEVFKLGKSSTILDPFCGTGTTLLESKLRGHRSIGIDANPVCVMVSKAKTEWGIDLEQAQDAVASVLRESTRRYQACRWREQHARAQGKRYTVQDDPRFVDSSIGAYLRQSGLLKRGWMSPRIALKAILVAEAIATLPPHLRNFLFLSFLGLLVPDFSNMAYGPELYCKRTRRDRDVFGLFEVRSNENLSKLRELQQKPANPRCVARLGDSANGGLQFIGPGSVDAVITSPPYLSDHDYSRLTRLELVFTGTVSSKDELRAVKKMLLRSSSKNVYKEDCCAREVIRYRGVREAIEAVSERARLKTSGFARVYPRLIGEYFGGMHRHFKAVGRVLRQGGHAAYVVGDQSSFFATPIPTASILAHLAEQCGSGLHLVSMEPVRQLRGTRGEVKWTNPEWVMLFCKRR